MAVTWHWQSTGETLHISLAAYTLTISFAGRSNFSFDLSGRLVGAWFNGITYRRALDNRILAKWPQQQPTRTRSRRLLDDEERRHVVERAYGDAARVRRGLENGSIAATLAENREIEAVVGCLDVVGGWDWNRLEEDGCRFHQIYKPVSILPPDQYVALVLQATEGCSYNQCTFCTFYRDRPFRIKSSTEFRSHIDQVKSFFAAGITVRRSIFLADANAVVIPQQNLVPLLKIASESFPFKGEREPSGQRVPHSEGDGWRLDGIYAFVSAADALRKTAQDFAEMRTYNLQRVYVGLETGHDPLRSFLKKQGSGEQVLAAVRQIKAGGVSVGLIFMVGIGGTLYRENHFRDTVNLIQKMPLDKEDLIYVSPFVPAQDSPYLDAMQLAGYSSLRGDQIRSESERFRHALMPWARPRGVRISRYDVREFIY